MATLPDASIDCVLTDPPYGTTACKWDSVIPFEPMWKELKRIAKPKAAICLFGSQPFTSALVMSNPKMFRYEWIWKHNRSANFAQAPFMPLKSVETVTVFSDGTIAQNSINRMFYNPQGLKPVNKLCNGKKANDHRPNRADQEPYIQTQSNYPTVVLEFNKEASTAHPTQKPVELLRYLIRTYTLENETVLDFTMGSGSTGVACELENRNFIGIEKDAEYFKIATNRIEGVTKKEPLFAAA